MVRGSVAKEKSGKICTQICTNVHMIICAVHYLEFCLLKILETVPLKLLTRLALAVYTWHKDTRVNGKVHCGARSLPVRSKRAPTVSFSPRRYHSDHAQPLCETKEQNQYKHNIQYTRTRECSHFLPIAYQVEAL